MKVKIKVPKISFKLKTQKVYPGLIDLEATPSSQVQNYNHSGNYGYDKVKINAIPSEYIVPIGTINITENGTTNVKQYENAKINVPTIVISKDIDFVDYDGTLLYSYSLAEIQELAELPELPSHEGLICQEWNFTLAEIKTMPKGTEVGATYITNDGKTRLYIDIETNASKNINICFQQTKNNGIEVDWGDGSSVETFTGTYSRINPSHTYTSTGNYVITLKPVNNSELMLGADNQSYTIMGSKNGGGRILQSILKKVELGERIRMTSSYSFSGCVNLETITVPNYITPLTDRMFDECYSLKYIVIPKSVTKINSYVFYNCYSLKRVTIPASVTTIGSYAFSECRSLEYVIHNKTSILTLNSAIFQSDNLLKDFELPNSITAVNNSIFYGCRCLKNIKVPKTVTTVENSAFYYCTAMETVDFSEHTQIPTVYSMSFNQIDSKCKIIVPDSLYDSWVADSGWARYGSQITKASEV